MGREYDEVVLKNQESKLNEKIKEDEKLVEKVKEKEKLYKQRGQKFI